jgi:conjugal transfer pilus assembly protein TraW
MRILCLVWLAPWTIAGAAHATDLGAIGEVFPIAEEDALTYLQRAVRERQASGELDRLQREHRARVEKQLSVPTPVGGLRRTVTPAVRHVDPSVQLTDDLRDEKGQLLFARGTRANPLNTMTLSKGLLLFDARDRDQVAWATRELARSPALPVLVAGSYGELMRRWNRPVYFDQGGALVRRFGLSQVPARITQDGTRLRIEEVVP